MKTSGISPTVFVLLALLASAPTLFMLSAQNFGQARNLLVDATCFVCAGDLAWQGQDNPYSPADLTQCQTAHDKAHVPFFYPPPSLGLFIPLSFLPYELAVWCFVGAGILALSYSYARLWQIYMAPLSAASPLQWGVLALFGLTQMAFINLPYGQVNLPALGSAVAFMTASLDRRFVGAGVFLGLAIVLKSHFALLALLPLLRWEKRTLIAMALTIMALASITTLIAPESWGQWFQLVVSRAEYNGAATLVGNAGALEYGFSLYAFLWRYFEGLAIFGLYGLTAVFVLGASLWAFYVHRRNSLEEVYKWAFPLVSALIYVLSPVTWLAHYVFLLPLIVYLTANLANFRGFKLGLRIIGLLILVITHESYAFLPAYQPDVQLFSVLFGIAFLLGDVFRRPT